MVVSWMYSSHYHYHALASDRARMLDKYTCRSPFFIGPIYINMMWLIPLSEWFTAPTIDSPVRAGIQCRGRLICLFPQLTRLWLISASPWWSSTSRWIISGLTHQDKFFYCKRDYYITELLNDWCRFISRSNMENLKTRGLWWHASVNDCQFKADSRTPGQWREHNLVRKLLLYWFKGRKKIFGLKMEDSGSKSGSREIYLTQSFEALNIRFKIPVQKEFISHKFEFSEKLRIAKENLLPWCAVQT